MSTYILDSNLANMFSKPPLAADGTGLLADLPNLPILDGLDFIEEHCGTLSDKEKWDALACVVMEVAHIDPREKGGYIITLGDLDITSVSPPLDLYVNPEEDAKVTFGVGSVVVVVGSPYVGREGDGRLAVTGWYCVEEVGSLSLEVSEEETADDWE